MARMRAVLMTLVGAALLLLVLMFLVGDPGRFGPMPL